MCLTAAFRCSLRSFILLSLAFGSALGFAAAPLKPVPKVSKLPPLADAQGEPSERPRVWAVELSTGVPELAGLGLRYRPSVWGGLWVHYALPTRLRLNVEMPSKTLLKKEGFSIKSPDLVLPVDIDFGPHWGVAAQVFPFQGTLFVSFGLESRIVSVKSQTQSKLIFIDPVGAELSNSVIDAAIESQTHQSLLRVTLGQKLNFARERAYFAWFLGAAVPLSADTDITTQIGVRNPSASDPEQGAANLAEAEVEQEKVLRDKARRSLKDFEKMSLPLVGLATGINF